jgi:Abnormal spindle-like microcephaly-assoc'd, ASPM-SPD-2-Hydin
MHRTRKTLFLLIVSLSFLTLLDPLAFGQGWINSVSVTSTDTTAVISWVTPVGANSQIKYGTNQNYGKHSPLDGTLVTSHSQSLKSLTANTQYHCRILSADSTGVLVTSLDYVFTTQAGPIAVTVSPTSATVPSGGTQQFTAQVVNSANQAVTWSVTAGTVSSSGLFTAPVVSKTMTATLTATSVADNTKSASATITVTFTASTLSANPASLAFGTVQVGSKANLSETLTDTGSSSVTISQANLTGTGFSISGLTLPVTLTSNQSVTFTATFAPTASGAVSGTLSIVSDAANSPLTISLSGTGASQGQLAVSPTTLSFGTVTVGASASLNGNLTATGASVVISSASSNSSEFVLSGITLPVTLGAGQSATFTVTFLPNASGTANASLTFTSNASNSSTTESLTGTGQAAASHWVGLTWNPSSGAVSYNVYRKLSTDQTYTQIYSGDTTTSYTDNNVVAGQTYDYVVTGVDTSGDESGYSNMAPATIPTP